MFLRLQDFKKRWYRLFDSFVQVADGVNLTLRGTNTQQNGDTMLRAGTFWRAFAANVVVGPEYTYTIEKVRKGSLLRFGCVLFDIRKRGCFVSDDSLWRANSNAHDQQEFEEYNCCLRQGYGSCVLSH